jgi:hypothetical protein
VQQALIVAPAAGAAWAADAPTDLNAESAALLQTEQHDAGPQHFMHSLAHFLLDDAYLIISSGSGMFINSALIAGSGSA